MAQHGTQGQYWGLFAPDYKILSETYREMESLLAPITAHSNRTDGLIRLQTGGRIDFWTLGNKRAGRSRKYHGVIVDEAAFAPDEMKEIWAQAIEPTLLDYTGQAWAMSTPHGSSLDNWFYTICHNKQWKEFYAPSWDNPFLPAAEIERLRASTHPLVFRQEYGAEFIDWSGVGLFGQDKLLVDGNGYDFEFDRPDYVYAVIDTALKDGLEHDGTAVIYFAKSTLGAPPLVILDWDVIQIEGALLEHWLPSVGERLEQLGREVRAFRGSHGMWIEDKGSGTVLIQQAQRKGLPGEAIDGALVAMGKEGRALNISGRVYRCEVKLSAYALDKTTDYRGEMRNHLIDQVCGFRIGTKAPHGMDLLDCFTYGVAIGLGNSEGY